MCLRCLLSTKTNEEQESQVSSKTQGRPHKQHTTDTGWNCPARWGSRKTPSLYQAKRACSGTVRSPTLTSQAFPAMPNRGPLPPDPPQAPVPLLCFQRDTALNPSLTENTLDIWDAPAVARFRFLLCKKTHKQF